MLYTSQHCKEEVHYWNSIAKRIAEGGQSYGIDNRKMERVSLKYVQDQIKYWQKEYYLAIAREKKRSRRIVTQVIPKDF